MMVFDDNDDLDLLITVVCFFMALKDFFSTNMFISLPVAKHSLART